MTTALSLRTRRVPDPVISSADAELRQHVQRVLSAHYEVDREIGRGGMGIVYLGRDKRLKRSVAIKLLPPELAFRPEIRSRFLREAETAAQLSHPNIVPIYSVDEREGLVYFIMGYVDGGNLAVRLHDRGPMAPDQTRIILREVADALAYAHARGVVHRDIKPDNILLCEGDDRPMVTDFGIARAITEGADSRLTATGMAIGTPTYMSPEQAAGEREIDGRSDLYSLGIVGYQMLVGEPPFTATSTPALLVKHLSETPKPLADRVAGVPADLAQSIMALLAKDPADRYESAAVFVEALDTHTVPESIAGTVARAAVSPPAGRPELRHGHGPAPAPQGGPSTDELIRWNAAPVVEFRKRVAPFLFVNAVIVIFAIFGGADFLFFTAIWSIFMAYRYAKLWSDGYNWRDVFRQPHDRMMFDVAAETIDDAKALFDPTKREQVRARDRARRGRYVGPPDVAYPGLPAGRPGSAAPGAGGRAGQPWRGPGEVAPELDEERGKAVRQALAEHEQIVRHIQSMSKTDRQRLSDVVPTANALVAAVRSTAHTLAEAQRTLAGTSPEEIEREITELEAQANPLDHAGSEERVRRLARLKRQRRSVADATQRVERETARLESCVLALQNMKLDLGRVKAGNQTPAQVTLLAERAMSLASDMDGLVLAEDAARRRGSRTESGRAGR